MKNSHKSVQTPEGFVLGAMGSLISNIRLIYFRFGETQFSSLKRIYPPSDTNLGSLAKILEKHGNAW